MGGIILYGPDYFMIISFKQNYHTQVKLSFRVGLSLSGRIILLERDYLTYITYYIILHEQNHHTRNHFSLDGLSYMGGIILHE